MKFRGKEMDKNIFEYIELYNEKFKRENRTFPFMELRLTPESELIEMIKKAIEDETPISIDYDNKIY